MEDSSFNLPILPTELINEILLRLPVKSLLQFRCVSKSWLALITSPQFIKTHLSLSANNKDQTHHRLMMGFSLCENLLKDCSFRSLFFNSVTVASDLNYPMELRNKLFSLVGSVNGLICLDSGTEDLFLWNPSIQKYKNLANSRHKYSYGSPLYGFGYDEFHDDYKVVVVGMFRIYGERRVDSKIYSLKGNFWRKINYCQDEVYSSQSGIFVNGKLHWTAEISTTGIRTGDKLSKIICIDLADENWGNIDLPCNGKNDHLGVLGNDLSIFSHDIAVGVDVWVMKEYGLKGSWTQMFTIKYPDHPRHLYFPSLFLSRSVGEILVGCGSVFMIYNAKYDSFKFLEVINFDQWWGKAEIYIESLVSPLSMDGAEDATKTKGGEATIK